MRRNGNGGKGGNGDRGSVPRWVRTLFDQHEARMAEMERVREEAKAEHEERMAKSEERMAKSEEQIAELRRHVRAVEREGIETRRQTREIIIEIGRIDRQRAADRASATKDRAEFVAALRDIRDSLKGLHGRVSRLEGT